jgi:hypothetical protein
MKGDRRGDVTAIGGDIGGTLGPLKIAYSPINGLLFPRRHLRRINLVLAFISWIVRP